MPLLYTPMESDHCPSPQVMALVGQHPLPPVLSCDHHCSVSMRLFLPSYLPALATGVLRGRNRSCPIKVALGSPDTHCAPRAAGGLTC